MKQFGMTFLPDVSDFYTGNPNFPTGLAKEFGTDDQDQLTSDYAAALSSDPGVVGYYVQDEPPITRQPANVPSVLADQGGDPSGFNLAVINHPLDLPAWKDTVDVLGVDPYPLVRAHRQRSRRSCRLDSRRVPGRTRRAPGMDRHPVLPVGPGIARGRPSSNCTT